MEDKSPPERSANSVSIGGYEWPRAQWESTLGRGMPRAMAKKKIAPIKYFGTPKVASFAPLR